MSIVTSVVEPVLRGVIRTVVGAGFGLRLARFTSGWTGMPNCEYISLSFPLTHNLYGTVDNISVTANLTRAAGIATVEDFENVVHDCLDGEARFWRARRVENAYQGNSDTIDTLTFPVIVDKYYILSVESADGGLTAVGLSGFGLAGSTVATGTARAWASSGTATGSGLATVEIFTGSAKNIHIDVYDSEVDVNLYENEYVESHLDHGANALGVQYFNTDRSGALLTDLRYCLTEEADAGYDPNSGIQGTTVAETLSIPLPAVLNQSVANNLRIEFDSYTVRDNVDGITTKIQYMIQGDSISNVLRLTSGTGGGRQFRKVINGVTYNTDVVEGSPLSRRRKHLTTISLTSGMALDIDGVIDTNPNTDDMLTFDAGDGLLWLGSNPTGGQVANSGFGNVNVNVIDSTGTTAPILAPIPDQNLTTGVPFLLDLSTHLTSDGGDPAITWAVAAGVLPAGLALDANTGIVSGTPTTAEVQAVSYTATNSAGVSNISRHDIVVRELEGQLPATNLQAVFVADEGQLPATNLQATYIG